jgi:hypothetical protein
MSIEWVPAMDLHVSCKTDAVDVEAATRRMARGKDRAWTRLFILVV